MGSDTFIKDLMAALDGLGSFLELRGDLAHVTGVGKGRALIGNNGDRQAHDREAFVIAAAVDGVDESFGAILRIVEIRDH